MFTNFTEVDFIILGVLCLVNIACIICIIYLALKNKKHESLISQSEEVKVTKIGEEESTNALEEIMEAMKQDLDNKPEDAVELFEQEQEEKAIISYQELLNSKNSQKEEVNTQAKTKGTPKLVTTPEVKFTNSEFVSPVFGKMDKKDIVKTEEPEETKFDPHELEKTLNIEPLTNEIKKNNEFLDALKEFRKSL